MPGHRLLVVSLAVILAGCIDPPSAEKGTGAAKRLEAYSTSGLTLRARDSIVISSGETTTIEILGVGWGRIDVRAHGNLTINTTALNPSLGFTGDRRTQNNEKLGAAYNAENYTFAYFYGADERPHYGAGFMQDWWGLPKWGPVGNGGSFPLMVPNGGHAILLVFTSVPGFQYRFTTGLEQSTKSYRWELTTNPDAFHVVPKVKTQSVQSHGNAWVLREREWTTGPRLWQPGLVQGIGWDQHPGQSAATGVIEESMAIVPDRKAGPAPRAFPIFPSTGGGSGFDYAKTWIDTATTLEAYRYARDTGAGMENENKGAAFMSMPLN